MNNPNPFVPKGSLLEQQSLRRSRLKITVGCVLAVSVCALVAMLIEGCKREAPTDSGNLTPPTIDTNQQPPILESSNTSPVMDTNPPPMPPPMAPSNTMVMPPPQPPPPMEPAAGSTYEVVSGDTLGKIAKAHGVTLKALEAANPGVDPKKLKIKQKLTIPAPTQSTDATSAAPASMGGGAGGETYVVKSGDTLTKIAKKHGVSLKALKAANPSLTTDHIKVGDKLTIPEKAETSAPATPATDTSAPPVAPAPAPAPVTPPASAPGH